MENETLIIALGGSALLIVGLFQWIQRLMERADERRQNMFQQIEKLTLENQQQELLLIEREKDFTELQLEIIEIKKTARRVHKHNKLLIDKYGKL